MVKTIMCFFLFFFCSFAEAAYLNTVEVTNFPAVQAVSQSGTWNINNIAGTITLPSGASTSANQVTANASLSSIDSKLTSPLSVAQSGTWNINNISGTVSLPTGAATAANQSTANASLSSIDSKLTSPIAVSQSGTWNINNISGTISLPTGAATAANQTTANSSLSTIVSNTTGLQLQTGANTFLDKTGTASLVNVNDASTVNTNGVGTIGVQITGTWVGTLVLEGTNDTTNWFSVQGFPRASTGATVTSTTGNTQLMIPGGGLAQFRIRRSVATSGTAVVTITASAGAAMQQVYQLNANSAVVTAQPGNTQNTTPWLVSPKNSYSHITTATTTTVKSGAGLLSRICYNTVANGSTATVYDNTAGSGTVIALITPPNGVSPFCLNYDGLSFATGLTLVTTGVSDLTVVYQ